MELIPDPDPDEEGTKISVSMWSMIIWYSKVLHVYELWVNNPFNKADQYSFVIK